MNAPFPGMGWGRLFFREKPICFVKEENEVSECFFTFAPRHLSVEGLARGLRVWVGQCYKDLLLLLLFFG